MISLAVIVLLFLFAIFDLHVGVSNDAVNFLNSAVGAKAAKFRTILFIAALGVFFGAAFSNGMMDVARHGVFHPQYFTYNEVICIMLAMMTTDVVLLDIFNTLGMPTSTTISLVFELLGGAVAIAIFKAAADSSVDAAALLNTGHALKMIFAIFFSVAVAFVAGMLVQWVCRLAFSFNLKRRLKYYVGLFGGIAITAITYFMVIKNLKGSPLLPSEVNAWMTAHVGTIMLCCFIIATVLCQVFYFVKINVLRFVVLLGTFALAMAFASNDLVNFIGVPLAGLSAYQDFAANAAGQSGDTYLMGALQSSARTPIYFLMAAGAIMIYSLLTSKKAQRVVKTSVDLARQGSGDEMFGASGFARTLVRASQSVSETVVRMIPQKTRTWIGRQFDTADMSVPDGAAFDMLRAAVNLVLSALLIAWGTSYKLPLSTTYVTFMVAMGTSLSDRAWRRESAVFRVTGVITVIGGWFITAGVAFVAAFCVASLMYFGHLPVMLLISVLAVVALVRSGIRFRKSNKQENERDEIFSQMMTTTVPAETWRLLQRHVAGTVGEQLDCIGEVYENATAAFFRENLNGERRALNRIDGVKLQYKRLRRRELLGLRRADPAQTILRGTYFHLMSNSIEGMLYGQKRLCEVLKEHLEKNFNPLPKSLYDEFLPLHDQWLELIAKENEFLLNHQFKEYHRELEYIDAFRLDISRHIQSHIARLQTLQDTNLLNVYVTYLSLLQETQAEAALLKQVIRNYVKFIGD